MALKTWSTQYPVGLDTLTEQPTLVNGTDISDVSHIHSVRDAVQALQTEVGSDLLESGSLRQVIATKSEAPTVEAAITAFSGGGQGSATLLAANVNIVDTVAAAKDSVKLPAAVAGTTYTVTNDGVNDLEVFPSSGEQIDSFGVDTGYLLHPGSTQRFTAQATGLWRRENKAIRLVKLASDTVFFDQTTMTLQDNAWHPIDVTATIPESVWRYGHNVFMRTKGSAATSRFFSIGDGSSEVKNRVDLKILNSGGDWFMQGDAVCDGSGNLHYFVSAAVTAIEFRIHGYWVEG